MAGTRRAGDDIRAGVRKGLALALAVTGLLAAACSSGGGSPATVSASGSSSPGSAVPSPYPAQHIDWQSCGGGFQCGTMQVPLDYTQPKGAKVRISVTRKPATGPNRIGSLLVNPGGPGGSGTKFVQGWASQLPDEITSRYDIVGFDPRGVDDSSAVRCLTDREMDAYTQIDTTPTTAAQEQALASADTNYGQECKQRTGPLLGHVSTVEAARDMDVLRASLGDPKLYYLGFSYGTYLGATYAELFPQNTGRLVLDGAVDPSVDAADQNKAQAVGFETALKSFADDCAAGGACPLGSTGDEVVARVRQLLADLDAHPLPGDNTRQVDGAIATTGVLEPLYSRDAWPDLRAALVAALRGDGSPLLALSDQYYERAADGTYSNLMYANTAVNCLDSPAAATSTQQAEQEAAAFAQVAPTFGTSLAWSGLSCANWPFAPTGHPHQIHAPGAAPILVVGTTRDPATPYQWAQSLASQLESATLLTRDGDGHTAYLRGSTCVDGIVDAYLLEGSLPARGRICE